MRQLLEEQRSGRGDSSVHALGLRKLPPFGAFSFLSQCLPWSMSPSTDGLLLGTRKRCGRPGEALAEAWGRVFESLLANEHMGSALPSGSTPAPPPCSGPAHQPTEAFLGGSNRPPHLQSGA